LILEIFVEPCIPVFFVKKAINNAVEAFITLDYFEK
jgi:hypothetical protein